MSTPFLWPLIHEAIPPLPVPGGSTPEEAPALRSDRRGLKMPFRRDGARDFATESGDELLIGRIAQLVGTFGEMPWRHELDSRIDRLRNASSNVMLTEFATLHCRAVLSRYEPGVVLLSVSATRAERTIDLAIRCQRVADRGTRRSLEVRTSIPRGNQP